MVQPALARDRIVTAQTSDGADRQSNPLSVSDEELMRRVAQGQEAAYQQLVSRHLNGFTGYANRLLGDRAAAEDVLQEAFLRVWTHARRFDPARAKFTTWFYRMVTNGCIDQQRKRRQLASLEAALHIADAQPVPDARLQAQQEERILQAALAQLPGRQASAIVLCHLQHRSNAEAAEILGVGVKALESLLSRGRAGLRALLKDLRGGDVL